MNLSCWPINLLKTFYYKFIEILNYFYKKLFMDLINKLIPTKIQTVIKLFLIRTFPLNFDRWAPKYPPVKEPIINTINKFEGTDPILAKKTAPIKFQKIPTVKNVILIARRKSISKVFIKEIENIFNKYHIQVKKFLCGKYIRNSFEQDQTNIFSMCEKIIDGHNENEIFSVPKFQKNKGFFEKFFNFFN